MAEARRAHRRDAIGVATCHRLLGQGAFKGARVSEDAAKVARKHVKSLLKDVAERCQAELAVSGRKTVSIGCVERAMLGHCNGITKGSLIKGHKEAHRGLPEAGVVRVVHKSLPKGVRISDDAKKALVGGAEAYLKELGHRSGDMAAAGKRKTLMEGDVNSAAKHMA